MKTNLDPHISATEPSSGAIINGQWTSGVGEASATLTFVFDASVSISLERLTFILMGAKAVELFVSGNNVDFTPYTEDGRPMVSV